MIVWTCILRWLLVLGIAFLAGGLIKYAKLPSILGWLIAGMLLGPHALGLLPQALLDEAGYKVFLSFLQCAFGLMLGTELVILRLRSYGKALVITTLTQSLGTFFVVSLVFALVFASQGVPVFLAPVLGSIALATAPAPALSVVREFHTKGPVTDTLLPMAVFDDVVGIVVFFTVNAITARRVSGGSVPLYMIPVMIFLPIAIGLVPGFLFGALLKKPLGRAASLSLMLAGIAACTVLGLLFNSRMSGVTLNYMLMGVSFSAVFSNMVDEKRLSQLVTWFNPILSFALLACIVGLGAPLDVHLILGAGLYTFVYIASRAVGKYFGARFGAKATHMPETVQKYLGLTLLPHSGVSLVFTGIACSTLAAEPALSGVIQGTIAAAAVINEIIAVITAKKGFELAGEIPGKGGRRYAAGGRKAESAS